MSDSESENWFRNRLANLRPQKESIAKVVLDSSLLDNKDEVYFSSGTTCFVLADLATQRLKSLSVQTNSVFVASHFAELGPRSGFTVSTPAGTVDLRSGMIEHIEAAVKPSPVRKLFVTTRGIASQGLTCRFNKEQIKTVISKHTKIYILATFDKIGESFHHRVKAIGQMGAEIKTGRRNYAVVIPESKFFDGSEEEWEKIGNVLKTYRSEGIDVFPEFGSSK